MNTLVVVGLVVLVVVAGWSVRRVAAFDGSRVARAVAPLLLGAWAIAFWQIAVDAFDVPRVILPAPSLIVASLWSNAGLLFADFVQTVLRAAFVGFAVGSVLGFLVALAIDRSPFLRRGVLPIAALAGTVPLVGIAPIMVMWFGFEWPSKAAVVVVMTFFPMLVNTLAGLEEADAMQRDLMRSYGASRTRTLRALQIPTALPFVFNALKVNSTLALIGAIVAEFFGSPTIGLGFRISTEAARLNMGLVWAAIVVSAVAGSAVYALLEWIEKRATFWHPSFRNA
jgi:NitT/TauT family transport system permease protein